MHDTRRAEDNYQLDDLAPGIMKVAGILGIVGLGISVALGMSLQDGGKHFFHAYLLNFMFVLSLSLGALFFVTLQHLTKAGWSVAVRRLAELLAANLPWLAVLFLPILVSVLLGHSNLYVWVDENLAATDHLLHQKHGYLNVPFFVARCVGYFAIWTLASRFFLRRSVEQDSTGDVNLTLRMERLSAPLMILFALSVTFAAFDLVMSLDPHWFSTIFGVYFFAGGNVGFFSLLIIISMLLQRSGILRDSVTVEHYHDVGKLLFGFVFFWGYIGFSQYMLIWYANIPEETLWFLHRQSGPWGWVSLLLLFGHFVIPFVGLISRHAKRRKGVLAFWAVVMLVMHWVDLYWLIMPNLDAHHVPFHLIDLSCLLGLGGLYVAGFVQLTKNKLLIPAKDPRLSEALAFENM